MVATTVQQTSFHGKDGAAQGIKHIKDRRRSMPDVPALIGAAHLPRSRQVDVRKHQADDLEKKIAEKRLEMKHRMARGGREVGHDAVADFLMKTPQAQESFAAQPQQPQVQQSPQVHQPQVQQSPHVAQPPMTQPEMSLQPPPPPSHLLQQQLTAGQQQQQQQQQQLQQLAAEQLAAEQLRLQYEDDQRKQLLQQQHFLEQQQQQADIIEQQRQMLIAQQEAQHQYETEMRQQQAALAYQQQQQSVMKTMDDEKKAYNMKVYEEMFPQHNDGNGRSSPTHRSNGHSHAESDGDARADSSAPNEALRSLHMRLGNNKEAGGSGGIEDERMRRAIERKLKLSSASKSTTKPATATAASSHAPHVTAVKEDKESLIEQAKEAIRSDLKSIISRKGNDGATDRDDGRGRGGGGGGSDSEFRRFLEEEVSRLRVEVQTLSSEKDGLMLEVSEHKTKDLEYERALMDAERRLADTEALPTIKEELRMTKEMNSVLTAEVASLKKSRKSNGNNSPQHRIEVEALREMVERLRESNKELLQRNSDLDQRLADEARRARALAEGGSSNDAAADAGVMQEVARLREANETLAAHNSQLLSQKLELEAVHSENSSLTLQVAEARQQLESMRLEKEKVLQEHSTRQSEEKRSEALKLQEVTAEIQRLVSGRPGREDIVRLENDVKQLQQSQSTTKAGAEAAAKSSGSVDATMYSLDKLVGVRSPLATTFNNSNADDVSLVMNALSGQTLLSDFIKRSAEAADFMRVERSLRSHGDNAHHSVLFSDLVFKRSLISGSMDKALLVITDQTLLLMGTTDKRIDWETSFMQVCTVTLTKDEGDETFLIETIDGDKMVLDSPRRDVAVGTLAKACQSLGITLGVVQNAHGLIISREFS